MDSPPAARIFVRNLSKGYGPVLAVHDLSLAVMPNEIFGLLGLNGAGKTTTLECILGLRRPDTGTITLGGINALASLETTGSHPPKDKLDKQERSV